MSKDGKKIFWVWKPFFNVELIFCLPENTQLCPIPRLIRHSLVHAGNGICAGRIRPPTAQMGNGNEVGHWPMGSKHRHFDRDYQSKLVPVAKMLLKFGLWRMLFLHHCEKLWMFLLPFLGKFWMSFLRSWEKL
jgi:hypothetical protein